MKYRKLPVIIEAIEWTGYNFEEIKEFTKPRTAYMDECVNLGLVLVIPTLEGKHIATKHDMIIKGVAGECYPVKIDIFEATYEAVPEET